jgi:serine/threonine protein kinase
LPVPGDVLAGRYRIDELLGRGGMGAVYRATQLGLLRAVAVKVLLPDRGSAHVRERFEREARVAAAMRHDGVVDVYDFGIDDTDRLYLVMELLLGESLGEWLHRDNTLALSDALDVTTQVATALASAHDVGLVHRDIKPDNIFVVDNADGRRHCKVVDFGLAFIKDGGNLGRLTSDNIISGTPDYMSPEQCRGGSEVGPATDVYALGCVLLEMLTGRPPFHGEQGEVIAQHLHVPAPRLVTRRPDLPSAVSLLVEHMLEKQPAQRPTARELVSAIAAATTTTAAQHTATRDRSARVIAPHVGVPSPQAPTTELATTDIIVKRPLVVVRGTGQAGLSIALAVNGFDVIEAADTATDEPGSGVEILLWASVDDVARRVAAGATVIAGADPEDLGKIAALVHAGAAEVLGTPVAVDELAPRVVRAQRRAARRKARP